jgi:hypothetical protein
MSKTPTSSYLNNKRKQDIESSEEEDGIMRDRRKRSRSSGDTNSDVNHDEFDDEGGFSDNDMDRKIRPEHIIKISAELLLDFS